MGLGSYLLWNDFLGWHVGTFKIGPHTYESDEVEPGACPGAVHPRSTVMMAQPLALAELPRRASCQIAQDDS